MLSVTPTAGSPEKSRSMIWAIMSVTPAAVWQAGRLKVSSGSRKAMAGRLRSVLMLHLRCSSSLLITQELEASEPDAGMVTTQATSMRSAGTARLRKKSHTSPSYTAPVRWPSRSP